MFIQPGCPVGMYLFLIYSHRLFYSSVYVVRAGRVGMAVGGGVVGFTGAGGLGCVWVVVRRRVATRTFGVSLIVWHFATVS